MQLGLQTKKKKNIVYGSRALNAQLPRLLQRPSNDWDIWTKKPRGTANELEQSLDALAGYDAYDDKKIYAYTYDYKKPVYRVIDKETGNVIADFTKTPGSVDYIIIGNIRYQSLADAKKAYKRILSDKNFSFRWSKARHDLWCIEHFEKKLKSGHKRFNLSSYPVNIFKKRGKK